WPFDVTQSPALFPAAGCSTQPVGTPTMPNDYHKEHPSCPYFNEKFNYYRTTPCPLPQPVPAETPKSDPEPDGADGGQPIRPTRCDAPKVDASRPIVPATESELPWPERARRFFLRLIGIDPTLGRDLRADATY